jgi:hypothetical protein
LHRVPRRLQRTYLILKLYFTSPALSSEIEPRQMAASGQFERRR